MYQLLIFILSAAIVGALVVSIMWITVRVYNRRLARVLHALPAGAWGATCVNPRSPRAWRALTADNAGAHLVKSNGVAAETWPWHQIETVALGRVRIGVVLRTGVLLHMRDGSNVGLLMPSRNTLRYPRPLAERAVAELQTRQGGQQ